MKKYFTLLIGIVFSITSLNAQDNAPPQAISYQAVIKRENGWPVALQNVQLRISIYQNNFKKEINLKYREIVDSKTNILGQVNIEIGKGTDKIGTFSEIPWSEDIFYLKVEALFIGSKGFQQVSLAQLLSVPYALYAGNAGPKGTKTGDILYWDGKDWVIIPPGSKGQVLTVVDSVPTWRTPCIPDLISPQTDEIMDNSCDPRYGNDSIIWSFKWKDCPGATKYRLCVKIGPATLSFIDTIVTNTEYHSSVIGYITFTPGWIWKVKAFVNGKWGPWSDERTFSVEDPNTDCPVTPEIARNLLFDEMKEYYLWYNMPEASSVTEANKDNYKDPYELLEAMRYKALDRFSVVMSFNESQQIDTGGLVGHGIRFGFDQDGKARISLIYNNSPLYANGVRRGWIIEKVNNVDVTLDLWENGGLNDLFGPAQEGITNTFLFEKPSGEEVLISSTKTAFKMNAVLVAEVLQLKSGPTGHLVYDSFFEYAEGELKTAFAFFKANGVKDLIVDLRYNGGGYLYLADMLSSYVVGNSLAGSTFGISQMNDKWQVYNETEPFYQTESPLDLSRVAIITTRSTASASELVINCLKPYINVVTIGDTTYGKPVGDYMLALGSKYMAWIIEYKFVNSQNQGDYWAGIPPSKAAPDDITHDFNDSNESCLKEAIYYLENGSVSTAKGLQVFKSYPTFSEKPKWMNRMIINKKQQNHKLKNTTINDKSLNTTKNPIIKQK